MDARAHLLSLGWAGPGHSLDSRPGEPGAYKQKGHRGLAYDPSKDPLKVGNTGNGLVKPLFISQRKNRFGIGKKAHEAPAGNEWWLKGFESALGNIGKSENERSSGTSTPIHDTTAGKDGGLYSYFVKGQMMQGTINKDLVERLSRKRKSDEFEEDNVEKVNLRPTSPRKPATAHEFEMVGAFMRERDKELKKRQKLERASDMDQFVQIEEFFEITEKDRKRKKRKSEALKESLDVDVPEVAEAERIETKEERRERRRKRREEKAAKAAAAASDGLDGQVEPEDPAARAARKAERKRRKAEKAARERK